MENKEDYLDALTAYGKTPPESGIPPILDQYLNGVAKNGETLFQWSLLKPLIVGKVEQVIEGLRQGLTSETIPPRPNVENVRFDVMHSRIIESLNKFNGAPFTIQRLCELLNEPKRHYKRSDKLMRGLEKNVLVVSTVDPFGRKVVSEASYKPLVNGMDMNGSPFGSRSPHTSTPLPPVPGWVTSPVTTTAQSTNSEGDHMDTQQSVSLDISTSGVSSGLAQSAVYTDAQGDTPLAVHAEEVIEETVVTMDSHDVNGEVTDVAIDGGESLAEEEIATQEHTNASEELSGSGAKVSSSSSSPPGASMDHGNHDNSESDLPDPPDLNSSPSQSSTSPAKSPPSSTPHKDSPKSRSLSWQSLSSPSTQDASPSYLGDHSVPSSTSVADTVTVSSCELVEESPVMEECVTSCVSDVIPPGEPGPDPCDSVAGLERLVDSVDPSPQPLNSLTSVVDPSPKPLTPSLTSTSSPLKHSSPPAASSPHSLPLPSSPPSLPSLPSQSCDAITEGEPQAKRCKLSETSENTDISSNTSSPDLGNSNQSDSKDNSESKESVESGQVDSTGDSPLTDSGSLELNIATAEGSMDATVAPEEASNVAQDRLSEGDNKDQASSSTSSLTSPPLSSSPPCNRSSSDSTGFEVTTDAVACEAEAKEGAEESPEEPMDQA